jgi:beta-lactamase class A
VASKRWLPAFALGSVAVAVMPFVLLPRGGDLPPPVPAPPVPSPVSVRALPSAKALGPAANALRPTVKALRPAYKKGLTRALDRYLDGRSGELAVAVRDLTTGASFTYNKRLRTATASIIKVNLVIALLLKAQRRHRGLSAWEKGAAARAIKVSDNAAASALWSAIGGGAGLAAANKKLGLRSTRPGPGGAWGSTSTSADDQVRLLNTLTSAHSPLTARHRRYVLGLMGEVAPEQAWGVSAAGHKGARVALKNGWLPRERHGGRWTVNSIGRVRDRGHTYLIAVISERQSSMGAGIKAVEHVSELVTETLSGR